MRATSDLDDRPASSTSRATATSRPAPPANAALALLGRAIAACTSAELGAVTRRSRAARRPRSALLEAARALGADLERRAPRAQPARALPLRSEAPADVDGRRATTGRSSCTRRARPRRCSRAATALPARRRRPLDAAARAVARRRSSATRRRGCACSRSRASRCRTGAVPSAREDAERDLVLPRPGRAVRPAASRGRGRGRALPRRRDPDHRRHRRLRADRGRDRAPGRHRARRRDGRHRRRSSSR